MPVGIRRVRSKERRGCRIYCVFCKPDKIDAVWRTIGFADRRRDYACDKHQDRLDPQLDDGYMTIADEETWGRL